MRASFAACVVLLCALQVHCQVVQTTYGAIQGTTNDGVATFLGIRYAAAPVGDLRWKAPRPPPMIESVFNATSYGDICPQVDRPLSMSEDCLTLNIFAPVSATKRPVMFWIHGGAFALGAALEYPGTSLANLSGNVVVTINYRVNSVGYLAHPALYNEDPNMNWGIQDQQAALRWVKANIDAFGGDRDNVMVFGESAGGASTSLHVLMNSSKGLVNKVIIQSPGPWILPSKEKAYTYTSHIASQLGCANTDQTAELACLRSKPWQDIRQFSSIPCVDGNLIEREPAAWWVSGNYSTDVPIVVGLATEEGNFLEYVKVWSTVVNRTRAEEVLSYYLDFAIGTSAVNHFQDIYFKGLSTPTANHFKEAAQLIGDVGITCGARLLGRVAPKYSRNPVYNYLWNHGAAKSEFSFLNSTHGSELAFVFNTPIFHEEFDQQEAQLALRTGRWWSNFAETGNPNGADSQEWPAMPNNIFSIGLTTSIASDFRQEACDRLYDYLVNDNGPLSVPLSEPSVEPVQGDEKGTPLSSGAIVAIIVTSIMGVTLLIVAVAAIIRFRCTRPRVYNAEVFQPLRSEYMTQ